MNQEIALAKTEEAESACLANNFREHMTDLPSAISISSNTPDAALSRFVYDYIDCLPDHLMAFEALSQDAGIENYVRPFLKLACDYFLQPPDILVEYRGMVGVFYKAYLCQRILEEVNDQVMSLGGATLVPKDMSTANIICHTLIGDKMANSLDHLVLLSLETTECDKDVFNKPEVKSFMAERRFKGWQEVLDRWPCFTKDCGVDLQLGKY